MQWSVALNAVESHSNNQLVIQSECERELINDLMTCIEKRKVDCRGALSSFDRTSIPVDAFAGMVEFL